MKNKAIKVLAVMSALATSTTVWAAGACCAVGAACCAAGMGCC